MAGCFISKTQMYANLVFSSENVVKVGDVFHIFVVQMMSFSAFANCIQDVCVYIFCVCGLWNCDIN